MLIVANVPAVAAGAGHQINKKLKHRPALAATAC